MTTPDRDQSEWLTRKRRIDPKLKGSGWTIVPFHSTTSANQRGCYAIAEYPTANGPADYALVSDWNVLGIVEAKKLTLGPQGVLTQAERYARGLPVGSFDCRGLRAPVGQSRRNRLARESAPCPLCPRKRTLEQSFNGACGRPTMTLLWPAW
jgi:hypothetical protein